MNSTTSKNDEHTVTFNEALRTWIKIALLSFGGPAGQIAVMHKILVDEKKWISENRFLHALNYCMLLPGPEAQQLATYIGWLLHRTIGGLTAGVLFVLPGFVSILLLSVLYGVFHEAHFIKALFFGLKAAVLAVVIEAVIRIGKRSLKNEIMIGIAFLSFISIFFFNVPFPLIILSAGIIGYLGGKLFEEKFYIIKGHKIEDEAIITDSIASSTKPSLTRSIKILAIWIIIWFSPVIALFLLLGPSHVLVKEAIFFSKAAVVTFGGAYSVLAYIAQEAVETYHWLNPGEMLDGLGMAETTPGPLIQVVQFIGFMGAYRNCDPFSPLIAALIGSVITTWVTYCPCFLWIFLGAPYIEHLRGNKSLNTSLSAITAAVVGVVLNLAVWFSLHVIFRTINEINLYGMRLYVPVFKTLDPISLFISVAAFIAIFRFKVNVLVTLGASILIGVVFYIFSLS